MLAHLLQIGVDVDPDGLEEIRGVVRVDAVAQDDRVDQPAVLVDQGVPAALVAAQTAADQPPILPPRVRPLAGGGRRQAVTLPGVHPPPPRPSACPMRPSLFLSVPIPDRVAARPPPVGADRAAYAGGHRRADGRRAGELRSCAQALQLPTRPPRL